MRFKWMMLGLCFLMNTVVAAPTTAALNKIVVFGDSLSDTGNLYEYMRHQLPMSPPYHDGRFTDGPVWIEHVLSHYFPENTALHLSNYAFGGSGVGSADEEDIEDDIAEGALLNLDSEVNSYLLAHDNQANASSLYVVWIGANNYLALPEDLDSEVQFTITGIQRNLELLVERGAKSIFVVGIPDLGRVPMAREFEYTEELSYVSAQHNIKLEEMINSLRGRYPDVHWGFFDVHPLLNKALNNPDAYGFKDVTGTCYDTLEYQASSQSILNMASKIKSRPHPISEHMCDTFLFFDPVHPSGHAHEYIASHGIEALDAAGFQFAS